MQLFTPLHTTRKASQQAPQVLKISLISAQVSARNMVEEQRPRGAAFLPHAPSWTGAARQIYRAEGGYIKQAQKEQMLIFFGGQAKYRGWACLITHKGRFVFLFRVAFAVMLSAIA